VVSDVREVATVTSVCGSVSEVVGATLATSTGGGGRRWLLLRPQGLFLHQRQYAIDILERAGMSDCKPCSTPVDTQEKLSEDDGPPVADATSYRCLTGALQYLTFSRPDIAYAVQ
jgi:hypothetical protein